MGGGVAVCIGGDTSGVVQNASILVRDTLVSGNKVGMESPLCPFLRATLLPLPWLEDAVLVVDVRFMVYNSNPNNNLLSPFS